MYTIFIILLSVVAAPITLVVALLIFVFSGLPIMFCQKRVGKEGKTFIIYKFRTMQVGADRQQKKLQSLNEADGPVFKIHLDPRYTPFGRFLSHTGLDELPQLINIMHGDMALFGPRPLPVQEAKKLSPRQRKRLSIKPGIVSSWVLDGYHKRTFSEWMESDLLYIKQKSFTHDVVLFFRSLCFMLKLFFRELTRGVQG